MTQPDPTALVSVVIAARNMERFLGETLDSLAAQDFARFEVVVVNDHSTDGTARIVADRAKDQRFRCIDAQERGVSAARNQGFLASAAPSVLFLDADDLLAEQALSRLHHRMAEGSAGAVLGGIARIAEDGSPLPGADNRALVPQADPLAALIQKNYIVNGGALLIRRSVIEASGPYNPGLTYGEDWEFWCRVLANTSLSVLEGDPVLFYRQVKSGANAAARRDLNTASVACLNAVAQVPAIAECYKDRLPRMLRARRMDIYWSNIRSEFQHGSKRQAIAGGVSGILRYPESLLRPRLALRLLRSLLPSASS